MADTHVFAHEGLEPLSLSTGCQDFAYTSGASVGEEIISQQEVS